MIKKRGKLRFCESCGVKFDLDVLRIDELLLIRPDLYSALEADDCFAFAIIALLFLIASGGFCTTIGLFLLNAAVILARVFLTILGLVLLITGILGLSSIGSVFS